MKYEFEVEGKITGKERPRINMHSGTIYTPNRSFNSTSFFYKI